MSRTIITQTPLRITLGGGGTDVYWYSRLRGGSWISAAINKYIVVRVKSSDLKQKIQNPIIRECLKLTGISGIDVKYQSDVSERSGLGGSGAFEVGLLSALYAYQKKQIPPVQLAEKAAYIEIDRLKKAVGPQDQYISTLGGIKYFEISTEGEVRFEPLNLSAQTISKLEENLLYFQTGMQRDAHQILASGKKQLNKSLEVLDQIKRVGLKVKDYLLRGEVDKFGESLHQHWLIKKRLSDQVSNPKIDQWYNQAIKMGALGGKIMGAGGGGWFVFYVNKNKSKFIKALTKLGLRDARVRFDFEGTRVLKTIS